MESISQTAFVVAHFRSNRPDISGDLAAAWWQLSYPYLFDNDALWFEADFTPMVRYKEKRAAELVEQGIVAPRRVRYLQADLSIGPEMQRVLTEFAAAAVGRRSLIVAEGLLYYLSVEAESEVLAGCGRIQSSGDRLALDIWPLSALSNAIQKATFRRSCS